MRTPRAEAGVTVRKYSDLLMSESPAAVPLVTTKSSIVRPVTSCEKTALTEKGCVALVAFVVNCTLGPMRFSGTEVLLGITLRSSSSMRTDPNLLPITYTVARTVRAGTIPEIANGR